MTVKRKVAGYRPVEQRINDYSEVELHLPDEQRREQASRCMDCAVPFCHWACPLATIMPEWQDSLYKGDWKGSWERLEQTNPFPEFTGRVCPALCEASCVLSINDEPVTIRQNELAVVEKAFAQGYVQPRPPKKRNGRQIAIIGAGPSGLCAAHYLNQGGYEVTVYEADAKPGGYLRYGIPDFKLDKRFIDRRVALMEQEGVKFRTRVQVGDSPSLFGGAAAFHIISSHELLDTYDAILIAIGAREPRDLPIPGREGEGIYQALDYLSEQNRMYSGERTSDLLGAYRKRVLVIGGGDTGADCVGTANRQGAQSVTQIELLERPSEKRSESEPWPLWPKLLKTSSSHEEGCDRLWSVETKAFHLHEGRISSVECVRLLWKEENGMLRKEEIPNSTFFIDADLVLLAMGFSHVKQQGIVEQFGLELDKQGNIRTEGTFHSSHPKVWATGDARRGASLVVHAIADGKRAAQAMMEAL